MSQVRETPLKPQTLLGEITKNGVTHVLWLPDSETSWLYPLTEGEPTLTLVTLTREGFAFSMAAGLVLGGKTPIIQIQNTGLMESGDSLRGWGLDLETPVVMLIGYRGWTRRGATLDSAAVYTERFLNAFNISYYLVESDADAPRISLAFEETRRSRRPVAVLVGDEHIASNFGYAR